MNIVLDTNVLLVSVSSRSRFHWIYSTYLSGKYTLCVTNDILFEYEEVLTLHLGRDAAIAVIEAIVNNKNTVCTDAYYKWHLTEIDPDDNKFVDCALAANAKYIVSEDAHFKVLYTITFPKVELLNIEDFKKVLDDLENL